MSFRQPQCEKAYNHRNIDNNKNKKMIKILQERIAALLVAKPIRLFLHNYLYV